jgi:hypothetical protein
MAQTDLEEGIILVLALAIRYMNRFVWKRIVAPPWAKLWNKKKVIYKKRGSHNSSPSLKILN